MHDLLVGRHGRARHLPAAVLLTSLVLLIGLLVTPSRAPAQEPQWQLAARSGALAPKTVRVTTPVKLTGRAPAPARRRVILERAVPGGRWVAVDKARTNRKRAFSLTAPTGWYASHRLRVRAPKVKGHRGWSRASRLDVVPGYEPVGSAKAYRFYDQHARWNPCRPIRWRYNPRGGFNGAKALLDVAVEQIRRATGLAFRYAGTTSDVPMQGRVGRSADLVIGWSTPQQTPILAGRVAGAATYRSWGPSGSKQEIYVAEVALDSTDRDNLAPAVVPDASGKPTWTQVFTHELGHTVGLAHVGSVDQMMNASVMASNPRLGLGDLVGMSKKGASKGCWNHAAGHPSRRSARIVAGADDGWSGVGIGREVLVVEEPIPAGSPDAHHDDVSN
ncbi:hypothetical protein [Nocardioides sp. R-C-SC26]|uniref:hypothetical protein n=1 Tax=Nocardioides sp. R-C-SC26 TaxID=2870414 RepID=UPI001E3B0C8B|nr:hypothetical protein [Nocardioides sp. R-C-SC26]